VKALFKKPGEKAKERNVSRREEAIRELIGCTFETRSLDWSHGV
jgi:hypothetical protein